MKYKMSKEEKELMTSVENEEWVEIENFAEEKIKYEQYAAAALESYKKIDIEILERDLRELQRRSIEEGLTYQTFIASILHKFITGKLVDQN
jgi:predicted DNA binding CopG/RHH family protein